MQDVDSWPARRSQRKVICPIYGPSDSISRVLASALLAPALSPVVFSVVSPFISISILPARRVRLSVPIVVVVRFMVCIDSHPVTISEDEPRRRP